MKIRFLAFMLVLLVMLLCACSAGGAGGGVEELSQAIETPDGSFTFNVPDDWSIYNSASEDYFLMTLSSENAASANIFLYEDEGDGMTAQDYLNAMRDYYGDNIIGDVADVEENGLSGWYFEYSMVDLGEDGNEYNYHGFEYFYDTQAGVLEIDISYSQSKLEGKLFNPSEDDLTLLKRIAQSVKENS